MEKNHWHLGRYATLLTLTETGLGSILHSFHVPFSGHFLSLNQGFLLTHATKKINETEKSFLLPTKISNIGALLKSLSPAGKKLTPMLAISTQGYLFSLGVLLFGANPLGFLVGMTLLSLWAFIQPVLIYYLIFGNQLFASYLYLLENLNKYLNIKQEYLLYLLLSVVLTKIILSWAVVIAIYYFSEESQENWFRKLEKVANHVTIPKKSNNRFKSALKGLTHPLFLISLAISIGFFISAENKNNQLFWTLARPLAIAFLIHFLFQFLPTEKWLRKVSN